MDKLKNLGHNMIAILFIIAYIGGAIGGIIFGDKMDMFLSIVMPFYGFVITLMHFI